MKAVYCHQYGGVENLKIVNVEKPTINEDEILVEVVATTVQTADWRIRTLEMPAGMTFMAKLFFGIKKPKQPILGTEFSGKVNALGKNVTDFKIGDEIVATTGAKLGGHAEFAKVHKNGVIAKKPDTLSFQEIVSLPFGGLTALDFLKYKAKVRPNDKVLVIGASGSVGVAGIQIAKILGANVTAVCSQKNWDFVKSLGADHVIDYSNNFFWKKNEKYNVIFDTVGKVESTLLLRILQKKGRLILVSANLAQMIGGAFHNLLSTEKIISGVVDENAKKLTELIHLTETGQYKAVIGKEFAIEDIAQAHQAVESRHKRGNIVVNIAKSHSS